MAGFFTAAPPLTTPPRQRVVAPGQPRRTTPRDLAELQASKETSSVLAKRYGLSRSTWPSGGPGSPRVTRLWARAPPTASS